VANPGLKTLATFKQLRSLDLFRTRVTDGGVEGLRKSLPDAKVLH
jgi:hypothetical protein